MLATSLVYMGFGSLAYFFCLFVYRLFFSPLSRYPGPTLAAISYVYEFYFDAWQPGNYIWQIQKLHEIYGPVVRVNPNELHINDKSFYDEIYAPIDRKRNVYDWSRRGLDAPLSLGATVDHDVHRTRRIAFSPYWSRAKVTALEPMINDKIDLFCSRLTSAPGVINLSDALVGLTVDIIGQFAFGKDYAYLRRDDFGGKWRSDLTAMMRSAKVLTHFNWLTTVIKWIPERFVLEYAPPALANLTRYKKEIRSQVDEVLASSEDEDKGYRTIFHHLRDDPDLPSFEKSAERLQQEGQVLIMAGSETTAKTLSIIMFHLLDKPQLLDKVKSELQAVISADQRPQWNQLEKLPYLTAVIHEGLRLNFGITGRNQRYTIDETLRIGQYTIPPGVPMSMMSFFLNADADIFPDPLTFQPARWLRQTPGLQFVSEKQKYLASFGRGARRCVAMNLAYAELYLATAAMVTRLSLHLFETDDSDVAFKHDFSIIQSKLDSKGVRVTVKSG